MGLDQPSVEFYGGEAPVSLSAGTITLSSSKSRRMLTKYIIDTLGERLHEGCNQAYILKFDRDATIYNVKHAEESPAEKSAGEHAVAVESEDSNMEAADLKEDLEREEKEEEVLFHGKESCKEYIKNFLAAIPIRKLEVGTPLHHWLQMVFHYTQQQQQPAFVSPTTVFDV